MATDLPGLRRRLNQLVAQSEQSAEEALIAAALAADQAAVLATPVDTGRARANWQATIDGTEPAATDQVDTAGSGTIAKNAATITRFRLRPGQLGITLSNNVEYIIFLEQGTSQQAPGGMLGAALQAAAVTLQRKRFLR